MKVDIPDNVIENLVDEKVKQKMREVGFDLVKSLKGWLDQIDTVGELSAWSTVTYYFIDTYHRFFELRWGEFELDGQAVPPKTEVVFDAGLDSDGFGLVKLSSGEYGYSQCEKPWIRVKPTVHRYGPEENQVVLEYDEPWCDGKCRVRVEDGEHITLWQEEEFKKDSEEFDELRQAWESIMKPPEK